MKPWNLGWGSVLALALTSTIIAGATGAAYVREQSAALPDLSRIISYSPTIHSTVLDGSGRELAILGEEQRDLIRIDDIPKLVSDAFIASEDKNFWTHPGYDGKAIVRAAASNASADEIQSGASTITQQLVKNIVLSSERSFDRKMQEVLLAARLEQRLTKEEILERYLNEIYLGRGAYGISSAAAIYFSKALEELSLTEAAFLAGLPKAPSRYAADLEAARDRMGYVLGRMLENNMISQQEHDAALVADLNFKEKTQDREGRRSHFVQASQVGS